ncbi:hypothetical protein CO057_03345 [Candidatus Uhrbacteria bacterium CG_4_9_14_0_2_um_filter_41_50]|uniref:DUF2304 domain-containing protein n=1 Tax=Candidatus Uhrbacteria bacterium CG_4_9_14_0_2_um_filter_41_50 TaxID=1975031 RepID=A0A2M8ENL1_9BACT|nr:MAG: hypothetical protein COZ45_03525 [Candidatus Uhrbacteria bacterium CG_4_10_14_3_um_filter_41_21]PIZ55103.1 MAG: hypothetical protein COY24_01570 [Candidatus Uhrbacteria bacterium CG_4_10_14_0_2_um_filter_41_21]PJB84433.1 MAG: hypothetical protein CO086_03695 [Candidatus Uhrbacteria bacterium CG_4_9_14_0_8_um_filter_41_16]PJC24334.1 MAG: hypothetical protein CO057_03345 [Candidatus Uhrbacteria bacterium CG_4_9_14_0_2_um_filter_41_50]PJE75303.1 MAG: hypothetical protein COV03_00860 [Candi
MIFQIALIAFSLFGILHVSRQYRSQKVSVYWFLIWFVFWLIVIAVALFPEATDIIADYVGVEKGADLIAYIAIVVLSYSMYRVLVRLERMRQEMTDLTRKIAIEKEKNNET